MKGHLGKGGGKGQKDRRRRGTDTYIIHANTRALEARKICSGDTTITEAKEAFN